MFIQSTIPPPEDALLSSVKDQTQVGLGHADHGFGHQPIVCICDADGAGVGRDERPILG